MDHYENQLRKQRETARKLRCIGPLPKIKNVRRRNRCEKSLKKFCIEYLPELFTKGFSEDHNTIIKYLEEAVDNPVTIAMALPRGTGKTTLCLAALLWVLLYEKKHYIILVCASGITAQSRLATIKQLLESPLLLEDFPQLFAIKNLERVYQRQHSQLMVYSDDSLQPTNVLWKRNLLRMPQVDYDHIPAAITIAGVNDANLRGASISSNNKILRPELVLCDDIISTFNANSPVSVRKIHSIVTADILGLAPPGESLSVFITCTVISPDDLATRILNDPYVRSIRVPMIKSFPTNMEMWDEKYSPIFTDDIQNGTYNANDYYKKNRKELDDGCEVYWEDRYNKNLGEVSAVQHAMNIYYRSGRASFFAEYQNNPEVDTDKDVKIATPEMIEKLPMKEPFADAKEITYFDIQLNALYYLTLSSKNGYQIKEVGTFPKQATTYFLLDRMKKFSNMVQTFDVLIQYIEKFDKHPIIIDSRWGKYTNQVLELAKKYPHVYAGRGMFLGVGHRQMNEYRFQRHEKYSQNTILNTKTKVLKVDNNYWKTIAMEYLYDKNVCFSPQSYPYRAMLGDQFNSQYALKVSSKDRITITQWQNKPSNDDDHFWDCFVQSMAGMVLHNIKTRKVVKFSDVNSTKKSMTR